MRHTILLFTFFLFLFGCSDKKDQDKKDLKKRNEKDIAELLKNTDAILLDENLNNYSFTFYEKFVVQNKTLAFKGDISDVSIIDSSLIIEATSNVDDKMYFAKIKVNQNLSNKIRQVLKYDSYDQQKGIFIIKISKVISKNIGFDEEFDAGDDENEPTTYISFAEFNKKIIIFNAELIDFVLE
jgi:hypothetical protein